MLRVDAKVLEGTSCRWLGLRGLPCEPPGQAGLESQTRKAAVSGAWACCQRCVLARAAVLVRQLPPRLQCVLCRLQAPHFASPSDSMSRCGCFAGDDETTDRLRRRNPGRAQPAKQQQEEQEEGVHAVVSTHFPQAGLSLESTAVRARTHTARSHRVDTEGTRCLIARAVGCECPARWTCAPQQSLE